MISITTDSNSNQSRTLLDAIERPLRRRSSGNPDELEDWPVLFPEKPATPNTIRHLGEIPESESPSDIAQQQPKRSPDQVSGSSDPTPIQDPTQHLPKQSPETEQSPTSETIALPATEAAGYRKPVTPSSTIQKLSGSLIPLSNSGSSSKTVIVRKPVQPGIPSRSTGTKNQTTGKASTDRHCTKDQPKTKDLLISKEHPPKHFIQPRQTKTSLLRARLSGASIPDDPPSITKPAKKMDFSTSKAESEKASTTVPLAYDGTYARPIRGRQLPVQSRVGESLSSATGSSGGGFATAHAIDRTRSSVENSRAPANWHPSKVTTPHQGPPEKTFDIDEYENELIEASVSDRMRLQKGPNSRRTDGVPASLSKDQNSECSVFDGVMSNYPSNIGKRDGRTAFEIFEERLAEKGINPQHSINETIKSSIPRFTGGGKSNDTTTARAQSRNAAGHSANDQRSCTIKRLSETAPDHGPTLRIFESADKIILGREDPKPELTPTPAPKVRQTKDVRRVIMTDELRGIAENARKRSNSRSVPNRAATSLGIHQNSGGATLAHEAIPKRSNTTAREFGSKGEIIRGEKKYHQYSIKSEEHGVCGEDPFIEVNSKWVKGFTFDHGESYNVSKATKPRPIIEEGNWIAPLEGHQNSQLKDSMSSNAVFPLSSPTARSFPGKVSESDISQQNSNADKVKRTATACGLSHAAHPASSGSITTPDGKAITPPIRRSSKAIVPDYTKNGSAKNSPSNPLYLNKGKGIKKSLSREFSDRQNRLGSAKGVGSVEVQIESNDCGKLCPAEAARKSCTSGSKDMVRNARDFVQKRSANAIGTFLVKKRGKSVNRRSSVSSVLVSPKSTGPFPPIGDVHPSHRPKKTSAKKLKAERKRRERGEDPDTADMSRRPTRKSPTAHHCPVDRQLDRSMATAQALLARARVEGDGSKRNQLLEFGKLMVDAITQAHDATIAAEEAKAAARRADFSRVRAVGSVNKIAGLVSARKNDIVSPRTANPNL